jgi:hypothetical protein
MAGTAPYMSPEQWSTEPLTAARDWYAVGVMLYEALYGAQPFTGRPSEVLRAKLSTEVPRRSEPVAGVPADLDDLCHALLRRDPTERPKADAILRALGASNTREIALATWVREPRTLVGRESHLGLLGESFNAVEEGATVTAHVHGPSGTGKSTILDHFLRERRATPDTVVLAGAVTSRNRYRTRRSIRWWTHSRIFSPRWNPPTSHRSCPCTLQCSHASFPRCSACRRLRSRRPERRASPTRASFAAPHVSALREMLMRIGQRRHLVLVIDDLQWGDVDSASVIGEVLQPPDPPRMLLVLAYRSEYTTRSACLATLLQNEVVAEPWQRRVDVRVDPLTTAEGEQLARGCSNPRAGYRPPMWSASHANHAAIRISLK